MKEIFFNFDLFNNQQYDSQFRRSTCQISVKLFASFIIYYYLRYDF